ncbi:MAG: TetR/AcrR family transcriptional regulator [Solirubrobacterales bacterium]
MPERRTQAERREATRSLLLDAGRSLFATRGYDAVGTEELVEQAGVTRGALYHHFDGKRGLFAAVFESVEQELIEGFPVEKLVGDDPFAALQAGIGEFLELSLDHELQRITLLDAPAVLGWEQWHEVQTRYGLGLIRAGVGAAIDAGQLQDLPADELAGALLGALIEAALYVSRSSDQDAALERMRPVLGALLEGLRCPPAT